jgi:6-phosphogluconolactonase
MDSLLLCVGSYTPEAGGDGVGVTAFSVDRATGNLAMESTLPMVAPSWVEWHPWLPVFYAANEVDDGGVTSVDVRSPADMRILNYLPTGGAAPCHLAVGPDGRYLLAANYGGGSVTAFALDDAGRLDSRTSTIQHSGHGPVAGRQDSAHPHSVVLDPTGELVSVVDLGTDEIRSYRWHEGVTLDLVSVTQLPAGTGPRQIVRSGTSRRAYLLTELTAELISLQETAPGRFEVIDTKPASAVEGRNLPAQLTLSQDREFAYISNRIPNTISVFDLRGPVPKWTSEHPVGSGWPRHFAVIGNQLYAGNQDSGEIVVFEIDATTGALTESQRKDVAAPSCIAARPAGPPLPA